MRRVILLTLVPITLAESGCSRGILVVNRIKGQRNGVFAIFCENRSEAGLCTRTFDMAGI